MRRSLASAVAVLLAGSIGSTAIQAVDFATGRPGIRSMSALAFGPDGVLFIGDGKGGAVFAIETGDRTERGARDPITIEAIEEKVAALLGATPEQVMIHDLAVNPISQNVYLAVSRGRGAWNSTWLLPNDIADAGILLRVSSDKKITEVPLESVRHARAALPNPVDESKMHTWKKEISLRADTITDMAFAGDVLYVAGLSNEEFASTMWKIPYPFKEGTTATTLEMFHGAHGEYETNAPIRTFVPYRIKQDLHILAAYLCTPLVTFKESDLKQGIHLKGRTVGEFGSGNYPLDMVVYSKEGKERLLIANSNLPFMIVDPAEIERYDGSITEEVKGYTAGIPYEIRSGTGVLQMDSLNEEYIIALRRLPGGKMAMESLPVERF